MADGIELSWLETPSPLSALSLIDDFPQLEGKVSDPLYDGTDNDRVVYKVLYLRNNGSTETTSNGIAYTAGLYLQGLEGYDITEILSWASLTDGGGRPYGAFTVWGYDVTGATSYVDEFIANTISPGTLMLFQHTHLQGTSTFNALSLSNTYRYRNGLYVQDSELRAVDGTAPNLDGEATGILRVLFGIRIPDSVNASHIQAKQILNYEEIV